MSGKHSKASKVFCGCCISIAVVILVAVILALYAFLYVPSPDKLLDKINDKTNISAVYYENSESASLKAKAMLDTLEKISDLETTNLSFIEIIDESAGENEGAYGLIIFTDSIGTAMGTMVDYIKFIMKQDSSDLDYHVSARGKAVMFGNASAEIEWRKVIF